mmetsp:Transcript_33291/g.76715  ORF Transcript_33291/g.76715 Transcript_33291/m.76715 type:complete len:104 (-) Transcript_33291:55-366(-)
MIISSNHGSQIARGSGYLMINHEADVHQNQQLTCLQSYTSIPKYNSSDYNQLLTIQYSRDGLGSSRKHEAIHALPIEPKIMWTTTIHTIFHRRFSSQGTCFSL